MQLTLKDIEKILNINLNDNLEKTIKITGSAFDSREVNKGDLFFTIEGENTDPHKYLNQVFKNGAEIAFVAYIPENLTKEEKQKCIIVDNVLKTYHKLANYICSQYKGKIIAVTGSAGKTTTRIWIADTLSLYGKTFSTAKNYNSQIGLPFTAFQLIDHFDTDFAVFELGMSGKDEIKDLTNVINPDIALVTNVYPMHIEYFNEFKDIGFAKAEIFQGLKDSGIAIINSDANFSDEVLLPEAKKYTNNIISFGKNGKDIKLLKQDYKTININIDGKEVSYDISENSEYLAYNSLSVLSVIKALNLDPKKAIDNMHNLTQSKGRGSVINTNLNGKKVEIIDHSYSGQPDSIIEVLKAFNEKDLKKEGLKRKVFIFGYMAELGNQTEFEHKRIGQFIKENTNLDLLITVGGFTKDTLKELKDTKLQTQYFDNIDDLLKVYEKDLLEDGDLILIKGSHHGSKVAKVIEIFDNIS